MVHTRREEKLEIARKLKNSIRITHPRKSLKNSRKKVQKELDFFQRYGIMKEPSLHEGLDPKKNPDECPDLAPRLPSHG
jgi:hypothetical protein